MSTLQAMIDKAVPALRKQNKFSVNTSGDCVYRSPDGSCCLVGHLIDDEHYRPSLEEENASSDGVVNALMNSGWDLDLPTIYTLVEAQSALHDQIACGCPEDTPLADTDFEDRLLNFCEAYELTVPPRSPDPES